MVGGLRNMLMGSLTCYAPIQCQTSTIIASLHLQGDTWRPTLPGSQQKLESEARNLSPCGCKSMTDGLRIVLGVFITLLCTYTMPNKHYNSKPTSPRWHLMAKRCLEVSRNWKNKKTEARNLPPCGCKSMVGGLRNMLNVFINLLCTYTMPNKHYISKPTSPRWHLMAKHCLEVSRNWKNKKTEARNLPPRGCKSMVGGLRNMLNVFINLLCTYTMPNKHYNSKPTSPRWHLMANRVRFGGSSLPSVTLPNKHYNSKPTSPRWHLKANIAWKSAEIGIWRGKKSVPMWL